MGFALNEVTDGRNDRARVRFRFSDDAELRSSGTPGGGEDDRVAARDGFGQTEWVR